MDLILHIYSLLAHLKFCVFSPNISGLHVLERNVSHDKEALNLNIANIIEFTTKNSVEYALRMG
jgi:hypothetical protein